MVKGHNPYKDTPDNHDFMTKEQIAGFLRNHRTGTDNLGRLALAHIISSYENPTVIDLACGTCVNWEVFKNHKVQCVYTGVDRTEGMLQEARKRYGDEITLVNGYVEDTGLNDNSGDIVIMRHILEHLQDGYELAIREGLRLAKKELIVVFFLNPIAQITDQIHESERDENGCTYFWNTYSWIKFSSFVVSLGVQMKVSHVVTPGAAHSDTIVRLIK